MNSSSPDSITKILIVIAISLAIVQCNSSGNEEPAPVESMVSENKIKKTSSQPAFLFISDIHLDNTNAQTDGKGGEDTGMDLWTNFLNKADSILAGPNPPSFILYTGDLPAHYGTYFLAPGEPRASHDSNMTTVLTGLRNLATRHGKPLFYLPGNNDAVAGDYYPFGYEKNYTPFSLIDESNNPYPALNTNGENSSPPCIVSQPDTSMGYYSANPVKGIRLIAMNTVIYTNSFFTRAESVGLNPFDYADDQMDWLESELSRAKALREKVFIAMHVPPGTNVFPSMTSMWTTESSGSKKKMSYLNRFLQVVDEYKNNCIEAILYGHTHMEELRRLKSADKSVSTIAISCPGISPKNKNNPGFKMVTYDSSSKALLDYTTYYTTLDNGWNYWGDNSYKFSSEFDSRSFGRTMYEQLSAMPLSTITSNLQQIYKVKNNTMSDKIKHGIEVDFIPD